MIPVCGAAGTRALDRALIDMLGMPAHSLMEVAGRGAAEAIHRRFPGAAVGVLCGPGNNGGDGFVLARWLSLWGHPVRWWASGPSQSEEARRNRALLEGRLGPPADGPDEALRGAEVGVDALLGTGQRRVPAGAIALALRALLACPRRVAIDLPTGLCAETGQPLGTEASPPAFDLTVVLGRHKPGLWASPGHQLAGELVLVDIGLDLVSSPPPPEAWLLEEADLRAWTPPLPASAAKWDRGHVAIRASGGAAVLAAHGAFRAGAGLVSLLVPRADWGRLHGLWPEVILAEPEALDPARHDALVWGPGLGTGPEAAAELDGLWAAFPRPLVLDADGLTLLARAGLRAPEGRIRAITPHSAEAARLLGVSRAEVEADRFGAIRRLRAFGTPLLKGPCSLIGADGAPWINPRGAVSLATAGSGDVLAGLVGGLLAGGLPAERALALAAWRHGEAGERLRAGATASDLVEALR